MKSVKVTCLVLLVGLTCIGLALVAAAPGQQATPTQPSVLSTGASSVPAPPSAATQPEPATSAAPAAPAATPAASRPVRVPIASSSRSGPAGRVTAAEPAPAQADQAVQSNWQALQQQAKAADAMLGSSLDATWAPGGYPGAADPEVAKWIAEAQKAEAAQGQLLAKYAQAADEKQRAEIKASLGKVLERQFDLQLQQREREVSQIEARVRNLREMIDKRSKARQTIVTGRLDQLLNEMDGMGWVGPSHAAPGGSPIYGPYGPAGGYLPSGYPPGYRSRSAAEPAPNPLQSDNSIRAPSTGAATPR